MSETPTLDENGHDLGKPFSIAQDPRTRVEFDADAWVDALAEQRRLNRGITRRYYSVEGVHPSHDMQPWASTSECATCHAADGTPGVVAPCGYDWAGRDVDQVVTDELAGRG